ncbi:MAG: branched-chain amino acid ABC transporter permease [Deltaproteobacteria bacterium]|nr:branched-chain amino acid ABC transporter permease [Deltaproteobacteria bacterium]
MASTGAPARSGKIKIAAGTGLLFLLFLAPLFLGLYRLHLAILVLVYILLTSSLRTIYISGQLSLGHAAFMGLGAYTSAILAKHLGWTPWLTIPIGGLSAMMAGLLIGFPFSRLRAIYFSMASLFFGIMITALTGVFPTWTGYLGGLPGIPRLLGYSKVPYYYFFLVLTLLSLLILYRIEHSRIGLTFKSVAQSYLAASSRGINEAGVRIRALALGCFFAGLAGAGYAHYNTFIAPSNFSMLPSIFLVVYLLVGGTGSFAGPIVGAFVLYLIPYVLGGLKGYAPFVLAGVLAVIIFLIPRGLVSLPRQIKSRMSKSGPSKGITHAA